MVLKHVLLIVAVAIPAFVIMFGLLCIDMDGIVEGGDYVMLGIQITLAGLVLGMVEILAYNFIKRSRARQEQEERS